MADDQNPGRADIERFRQHLKSAGVTRVPNCPVCGVFEWTFAEDLVRLMPFDASRKPDPSAPAYGAPVALLFCRNCSFFFPFLWEGIKSKSDGGR